ncbi:MAG: ComEA family DNA-binding protein [Lachnospiraceae bacterium]|nr:ComEA family DNA-binding protein [Lachnospiraceae bacterium]
MRKIKNKVTCITGCLVLTVLLFCGCSRESDLVISTADPVEAEETVSEPAEDVASGQESSVLQNEQPATIYVQVTGAVRNPGVYELPEGSRVFEAVQKAGGMTDDAAPESVNQAVEVADGAMIVLYTKHEWGERVQSTDTMQSDALPENAGSSDGRVNINTADLEQLCTIPGIGQTRAQSIITYREQNGAFGCVEDIMKVSGIKDGLFEKIKDKIKV